LEGILRYSRFLKQENSCHIVNDVTMNNSYDKFEIFNPEYCEVITEWGSVCTGP